MDELETLEQLLQEFLSGIQEVLQSGETLSEAFQGQASEYLNMLTSRIDEVIIERGTQATEIPPLKKAIPSSVINAFKYDDKSGNLLVQFKGKYPNEEGSVYSYGGVPKDIFELFRRGAIPAKTDGANKWGAWWKGKSPSAGSSMNVLLKGMGYPYKKLS